MASSKDYAISLTRFVALMLVVFCHTFEWIGYTLNESMKLGIIGNYCAVGVQIFLIISGYLYGSKSDLFYENGRIEFIISNFKKILLDYYIYVLIVIIPIYFFLQPGTINLANIFRLMTCSGVIGGCIIYGLYHIFY